MAMADDNHGSNTGEQRPNIEDWEKSNSWDHLKDFLLDERGYSTWSRMTRELEEIEKLSDDQVDEINEKAYGCVQVLGKEDAGKAYAVDKMGDYITDITLNGEDRSLEKDYY